MGLNDFFNDLIIQQQVFKQIFEITNKMYFGISKHFLSR
jgi:hypothetical protein